MVLFFKLFSVLNVTVLALVLLHLSDNKILTSILLAAFLCVPATIVHLFGGLETFLFGSLLGLLFIALERNNAKISTILAVALILTRPEAWVLIALVPMYFLAIDLKLKPHFAQNRSYRVCAILVTAFALYVIFHWSYFGYIVPNTFYSKSGGSFDISKLLDFWVIYTLPLMVPLFTSSRKSALFCLSFLCPGRA
ncbi:hypothetical protein ACFE33_12310 [Falsihalocynthiibacter sp. SS001]|uniref:hypothetical protein n=1 Tax=Falsihalocynthiibacter sp. SS001 TaxID=3349698 RepID=UPI0036D417C3